MPHESSRHKKTLATLAATAALLGGFAATVYVLAPHDTLDKEPVTQDRPAPASPGETTPTTVVAAPAAVPIQEPTVTTAPAASAPAPTAAPEPPRVTPTTLFPRT